MKAEEFIKAHRAEYNTCDAIYSSYHYDAMERYANQRVIEELEELREDTDCNDCCFLLEKRIKERKQTI